MLAYTYQSTIRSSGEDRGFFHSLGIRVLARFARAKKPIDHLGDFNPDQRLPARFLEIDRYWTPDQEHQALDNRYPKSGPKYGSTHEYMEVAIG